MTTYTEKAIVNLLIIAIRLSQTNNLDVTVIMTLQSLIKMNTNVAEVAARKVFIPIFRVFFTTFFFFRFARKFNENSAKIE
jgi:hypothetical protein